jgi:transposase
VIKQMFSKEFKQEAVRLLEKQEKDASQLARELGVRRNQLYKWQKELESYGDEAFPGKGRRSVKQDETANLKARIKRLEQENEILKKAAVYFAKEIG